METDGRFDSGKCGEGLIFLITTGSIDTIEYRESLGISCFQGFLAIYRYKENLSEWMIFRLFVNCSGLKKS